MAEAETEAATPRATTAEKRIMNVEGGMDFSKEAVVLCGGEKLRSELGYSVPMPQSLYSQSPSRSRVPGRFRKWTSLWHLASEYHQGPLPSHAHSWTCRSEFQNDEYCCLGSLVPSSRRCVNSGQLAAIEENKAPIMQLVYTGTMPQTLARKGRAFPLLKCVREISEAKRRQSSCRRRTLAMFVPEPLPLCRGRFRTRSESRGFPTTSKPLQTLFLFTQHGWCQTREQSLRFPDLGCSPFPFPSRPMVSPCPTTTRPLILC